MVHTTALLKGARYDVASRLRGHLFVISPNNSGSTFLRKSLEHCQRVWSLKREGQHTFGFSGPHTSFKQLENASYIWAGVDKYLKEFSDPTLYNWDLIKKAWYFQAHACAENADIFVTSSPPLLLHVEKLMTEFKHSRFIYMVRNPYAVVEGIIRGRWATSSFRQENMLEIAARHVMVCFKYQKRNLEQHGGSGMLLHYEKMCDEPVRTADRVHQYFPELDDFSLDHRIVVKGRDISGIQNMNKRQIQRLTAEQLERINMVFIENINLLSFFGYKILSDNI